MSLLKPTPRQLVFSIFVKLRRVSRSLIEDNLFCYEETRVLRRQKNKMAAANNPFDRRRIDMLTADIKEIGAEIEERDQALADLGECLMSACAVADDELTFSEKAQLLGVSETHLRNQCSYSEDKRMFTMIFACHAEYRGNEDVVDFLLLDAPLWGIASAWFFHLLKTNKQFSDTCSEGFDKVFPHIPKYQQVTYSDGTTELKRLPPNLQLVSERTH